MDVDPGSTHLMYSSTVCLACQLKKDLLLISCPALSATQTGNVKK